MINLRSGKKQKSRLRKECNKKNSERINIHQREDYRTEDLPTVFDAKKKRRTQIYEHKNTNPQIHKYTNTREGEVHRTEELPMCSTPKKERTGRAKNICLHWQ